MKESPLRVIILATLLLASAPLKAQDTLPYHFGVGISVEPALFGQQVYYTGGVSGAYLQATPVYSISPFYIYFPVMLAKNFRIEPRFGIYSFSNESTSSGAPTQPDKSTYTLTDIGLAAEYVIPAGEKFQLYAGARGNLNFISYSSSGYSFIGGPAPVLVTGDETETDVLVSALFGAEYLPMKGFSIGGEVDFNYVSYGNPDLTITPPPAYLSTTSTLTRSLVSTGALFFVRWYFL